LDASVWHPLLDANYLWSTGETGPAITVDGQGAYAVQVVLGCDTLRDTVHVAFGGLAFDLGPDRSLCAGDSASLEVPAGAEAWWWSDDGAGPDRRVGAGEWGLTVSDSVGCLTSDTVLFNEVDCACAVWVPNVITPNGDGINEVFLPIQRCDLRHYALTIHDRWGRLAWRSDDPDEPWDGRVAQDDAFTTLYAWQLELRWWDGVMVRGRLLRGHISVLK
jgi:gliding motility-associated-like protein